MSVAVETLFTSAFGLWPPWVVEDVKLGTANRRIDFEIGCQGKSLACPACGVKTQPVHVMLRRPWRHRLPANAQTQAPAHQPVSAGRPEVRTWLFIQNDMKPPGSISRTYAL